MLSTQRERALSLAKKALTEYCDQGMDTVSTLVNLVNELSEDGNPDWGRDERAIDILNEDEDEFPF
jgi:hypothetical protein